MGDGGPAKAARKPSQVRGLLGGSADKASRLFQCLKHATVGDNNRPHFVLLALCLYALMASLAVYLAFVFLTMGTEWGNDAVWTHMAESLALESAAVRSAATGRPQELIPGFMARDVVHFWGGPLVMVLAAIALFCVPERRAVLAWLRPLGGVLGVEIRSRWLEGWCGGLSVGEAVFLGFLLLRNVVTVEWIVGVVDEAFRAQKKVAEENGVSLPYDDRHYEIDGVAFALGVASFKNLMWLFFPIARISPIFEAHGLPFEKRIRYHRWLGHFTLAILTIHGALYWALWARQGAGEWRTQALDWTPFSARGTGINHLAGAISLGFGLVLWFTALEWVRRRYFEVFYRTHIVSFLGFLVFAVLHAPGMHINVTAGLLLYCLDIVLRLTQLSTPVEVEWSSSTSDNGIVSFGLETMRSLCPFSTLFINARELSKFQWHPVSPICNGASQIKICYKDAGKWTRGLVRRAKEGALSRVKINGPYHSPTLQGVRTLQHHEWVVLIVGGVAITPLLTLLKHLAANAHPPVADTPPRSESTTDVTASRVACPRGVVVVWSIRSIAEAEIMNEMLYAFSRRYPGFMDLRIHITGKSDVTEWERRRFAEWGSQSQSVGSQSFDTGTPLVGDEPFRTPHVKVEKATAPGGMFQRVSPKALPMYLGSWHLAAMYVVLYGGGLTGLLLGMSYRLEVLRAGANVLRGKVDIVAVFSIFLVAMGLVTLLAFPAHLLMYMEALRSTGDLASLESRGPSAVPKLSLASVRWIAQNVRAGRPDIGQVLDGVMRELTPGNTAAMFTGGPKALITDVKLACAKRSPMFSLQQPLKVEVESFEL